MKDLVDIFKDLQKRKYERDFHEKEIKDYDELEELEDLEENFSKVQ